MRDWLQHWRITEAGSNVYMGMTMRREHPRDRVEDIRGQGAARIAPPARCNRCQEHTWLPGLHSRQPAITSRGAARGNTVPVLVLLSWRYFWQPSDHDDGADAPVPWRISRPTDRLLRSLFGNAQLVSSSADSQLYSMDTYDEGRRQQKPANT